MPTQVTDSTRPRAPGASRRWRSAVAALVLFLTAASFTITKTGRDVLYVQGAGVRDLPVAYLCMAMLAPLVAMAVLAAMLKWGARRVRIALPASVALVLISVPHWAYSRAALGFLFIFVPVIFGVVLSSAWLFAAESVPTRQEDRIHGFSVLGAASMLGSIAGAGAARIMAQGTQPAHYLTIGAGVLLIVSILITAGHYCGPHRRGSTGSSGDLVPSLSNLKSLLSETFIRALTVVVIASSATGVLVEYLFYMQADSSPAAVGSTVTYFADLYLWLNGGGFALQLMGLPILQRRLGLGKSLMLVPIAVGIASLFFVARLVPAGAVRAVEGGLKSSLYRSGWEQSYALLAEEVRALTKILIDGVASRLGEAIAALGLVAGMASLPSSWNRPALTAAAIAGAALTWAVSADALRRLIERHEDCVIASGLDPEGHPVDSCVLTATLGRRLD